MLDAGAVTQQTNLSASTASHMGTIHVPAAPFLLIFLSHKVIYYPFTWRYLNGFCLDVLSLYQSCD